MQRPKLWKFAFLAAGLACLAMPAGALITVGSLDLYSEGATVVVRDGLAYVGTRESGLVIADVSDPNAPIKIGAIAYPSATVSGVVLEGGLAYLAVRTDSQVRPSSLRIVDISDPAAPVEIGSLEVSNTARGIAVVDHRAYLTVGEPVYSPFSRPEIGPSGLRVIDVANPLAPVQVGAIDFTGAPSGIQVVGDLAYIADGAGLRTIDVSEPTAPVEIHLAASSGVPNRLTVVDGLAYVTNGYSRQPGGLSVFDLSDPKAPDQIGYLELRNAGAFDVAVEGNFAYVAGERSGLWALDVSDPKAPIALGRLATPFGAVAALAVADGVASVIDTTPFAFGGYANLQIIDLSTPTTPTEASITPLRGTGRTVEVVGDLAYAVDTTGLLIIDVSDPEAPVELGAIETPGFAQDVSVVGSTAYVADRASGLRVIDVSNPTAPVELSGIDNLGNADQVEAVDGFAYLLDNYDQLRVIDVSDAEAPVEVGSIEIPGAGDFAVVGERVYVVGGEGGLRLIDISNPEQPVEIAAFDEFGSGISGIAVSDGLAYLARWYRGLLILDVSNPEQPVEIGVFDPWYYVNQVAVAGGIAYLGTDGPFGGSGAEIYLRAVDVSDPTAPVEIGGFEFDAPPSANLHPTVVGSLVYVIGYAAQTGPYPSGNGLWIIDFGPEYAPKIEISVDIKPSINPARRGVVSVAILGSETFDIADIDLATLRFGPDGAPPAHSRGGHPADTNGDGAMDLVSHFWVQETGITSETDRVCVSGKTLDGIAFEGCGAI